MNNQYIICTLKGFLLVVVLLVSGCQSIPKIIPGITTDKRAESAVVLRQGSGTAEAFAFLTAPLVGSRYSAIIEMVDDHKVVPTFKGKEWWLSPGKHKVNIKCGFILGAPIDSHYMNIDIETIFEAGHTYQLTCSINQNQWLAQITDVTDKIAEKLNREY